MHVVEGRANTVEEVDTRNAVGAVALRARGVHKTYRLGRVSVPVLRGVDLDVERGRMLAIVGASGSGKSTLLHLLGGLDRPDAFSERERCAACGYSRVGLSASVCPECGKPPASAAPALEYEGRSLVKMSAAELNAYRAGVVGFVFQFYHLLPELTVLNNVCIAAMIRHGRIGYASQRREIEARASGLLSSFGLGHRLKHRPTELSGGERQRVAIARALVNEPRVLLADEPTGNLDRATGGQILELLLEHRARTNLTFVLVTHDREVAERADRTAMLVDGRIATP